MIKKYSTDPNKSGKVKKHVIGGINRKHIRPQCQSKYTKIKCKWNKCFN